MGGGGSANRRWFITAVAAAIVLVGVAGAAGAWATSFDRRTSGRLLPGTVIQGVPVGDLSTADAIRLLRTRIEAPLHRQLTVRSGAVELVTTPWDLGLQVDVKSAVGKARGEVAGTMISRVWRRLFTAPQRVVAAEPRWRQGQLDAALRSLADRIRTAPVDASIDTTNGWVTVKPGRPGTELDRVRTKEALSDAVQLGDDVVPLPTQDVAPAVGKDDFRQVILVRTGENKLYLYRNGSIAKEWPVATGSSSYATPTGQWQVVEKLVDPVWYNPGSSWATGMPAHIGPGPNNPLGSHALALDAPAILIHATPDRSSIGYNVSHGCIRMLTEHEIELFDQVDVGTPVAIVNAGTPQPRATTPTTTDAAQSAAVQF